MALKVGDNFAYQGQKPNFERDTFSTLSQMKNFPTTSIDEGHISLCLEDGKRYKYSASFSVDNVTGRWRRVVDTALDATSENPVQNKVIVQKFKSDEEEFAKKLESLGQVTGGVIENTKTYLLEEDARNRKEIEETLMKAESAGAAAINELREVIKDNEEAISTALNDKVPVTREINGHDLSENVTLTKEDVGLGRVDNTGDLEKPISLETQGALDTKVDKVEGYTLISEGDLTKLKNLPNQKTLEGVLTALGTEIQNHENNKENPHEVTKDQVGLGNVDNTSDIDKPISTATQEALDTKVDKTTTVNGYDLSGNIVLGKEDVGLENVDNTSDLEKPISTATQEALDKQAETTAAGINELREEIEVNAEVTSQALIDLSKVAKSIEGLTINGHPITEGNITISKDDVGLGNVENTGTSNLPISEATQEALDTKVDKATTINTHPLSSDVILTPTDIGLGKVNNTSDSEKPVSLAQQAALDGNVDKTTTVNGHALSDDVEVTLTDLGLQDVESLVLQGGVSSAIGGVSDSLSNHKTSQNNPHNVTKTQVGLGNVDNTSDSDKPISTAQREALDTKANRSTTINGHPLSSNVVVTKGDVGLGNVDNTSDLDKPISQVQQEALDLKTNITDTVENEKTAAESIGELKSSFTQLEETTAAALGEIKHRLGHTPLIWTGTEEQYQALETKDSSTLYIIL